VKQARKAGQSFNTCLNRPGKLARGLIPVSETLTIYNIRNM
jgi:hypothetical protein